MVCHDEKNHHRLLCEGATFKAIAFVGSRSTKAVTLRNPDAYSRLQQVRRWCSVARFTELLWSFGQRLWYVCWQLTWVLPYRARYSTMSTSTSAAWNACNAMMPGTMLLRIGNFLHPVLRIFSLYIRACKDKYSYRQWPFVCLHVATHWPITEDVDKKDTSIVRQQALGSRTHMKPSQLQLRAVGSHKSLFFSECIYYVLLPVIAFLVEKRITDICRV